MTDLEIHGQEDALQALAELDSATLLFVGPDGVGRRRAARWLAALRNCAAEGQLPCRVCASCIRFGDSHPDYREVEPRLTTRSGRRSPRPEIRIGQLVPREGEEDPLSRWLEQRPSYRMRVGVIDGAETLTAAAANSFLKMLEEPPSFATIVLIAPSPRAVLPTIASRCAVVRFRAVDTSHLGLPGHPAHRLGRPGPLIAAAEGGGAEEAMSVAARFVDALHGSLLEAIDGADALAEAWQDSGPALTDMLRERMRELPASVRARADDLLLESEQAIAGYSPPGLALRVLALELRAVLRRHRPSLS